jgi:hypothetical protein
MEMGNEEDEGEGPLGTRVIAVVQDTPDRTIRPARLATQLGISINEACAELCGLMAAVGGGENGATFTFERGTTPPVMVFTFPEDFAKRAIHYRQKQERWLDLQEAGRVAVKALKILTAFGLILSLLILLIAAIVGVIAVLIASQNDRGGRGRALVLRQLHSLVYTGRQLLWCWALFGPSGGENEDQDPFLRETAYDLALICSICCGNPSSLFFWFRARQLSDRRRQRLFRGWAQGSSSDTIAVSAYGVEGVTLLRGTEQVGTRAEHRGLLSVAVEFLFGPTPFHPSVESDKWKLRAAIVVQTCTTSGGITLQQLAPYTDYPPSSLRQSSKTVEQGIELVAFLNGIPRRASESLSEAVFIFPELMSESSAVPAHECASLEDSYDGSFLSMLYNIPQMENSRGPRRQSGDLPLFWKEPYYHFTKLSSSQFMYCVFLGMLNAIGVFWLAQSLQINDNGPDGALGPLVKGNLRAIIVGGLVPVLSFYAKLFFVLPAVRLLFVWYLNTLRRQRNMRRESLSSELQQVTASISP